MKGPLPLDCRMDVTFRSAPHERPAIYDFFWDAAPQLYRELNQNTVQAQLTLPTPSVRGKKSLRLHDQRTLVDSFAQKFSRDKRFKAKTTHIQTPGQRYLRIVLPTDHLESALSAYNILFEAGLNQTTLSSPELTIDFAGARENKVRIHTSTRQVQRVKKFLAARVQPKPHVYTLTVGLKHPLQTRLSSRPARRGK